MQNTLAMWLVLLFLQLQPARCYDVDDYVDSKPEKSSPVEVRAVFINCEPYERESDTDTTRFERQELFKHNALQECKKKLALTVKMASESDQNSGDEYIPIDHVLEGLNKKRVRLLNPYVLRLRREPPIQAYKLRRIDTVSGVLTSSDKEKFLGNHNILKRDRAHRGMNHFADAGIWSNFLGGASSVFTLDHDDPGRHSYSVRVGHMHELTEDNSTEDTLVSKDCGLRLFSQLPASSRNVPSQTEQNRATITIYDRRKHGKYRPKDHFRVKRDACLGNQSLQKRDKRYQQNVKIEGEEENNSSDQSANHHYYQTPNIGSRDSMRVTPYVSTSQDSSKDAVHNGKDLVKPLEMKHLSDKERNPSNYMKTVPKKPSYITEKTGTDDDYSSYTSDNSNGDFTHFKKFQGRNSHKIPDKSKLDSNVASDEKDFALYEIGNPSLWFKVTVQLFEKLSSPEGKTVWNDITKGDQASVGATNPEWISEDMNLRYRPVEWLSRDEFTLPTASLCLLMPVENADDNEFGNPETDGNEEYIVVPVEDIIGVDENRNNLIKRDDNYSDLSISNTNATEKRRHRHVEVRVARALLGDREDRFSIATHGSDRFLTLPHRRPHRAQLDLEARADDNQLVRVGSAGCIATIVADNTRKTRTIITLQATNTGLASARFRVTARDCGPELSSLINEKNNEGTTAGPVLLPPRHTRRLRLELPVEIPVDLVHCSVALLNDNDESVAMRDVAIKKGDRCFCVWHCDCVCLSEDPKLLCREMSPPQQAAAGLPARDHSRRARAACYPDVITINMTVIMFGVIIFLLLLGLAKALLGFKCRCVALYGLCLILPPRKLDHYYEKCLRGRTVVYDFNGWPVHPDSKKCSVLPVSRAMLFLLNFSFFLVLPFVLLRNAVQQLCTQCHTCAKKVKKACNKCETKKCFSSQDNIQSVGLQLRRRRRPVLRRWMTPHAEQLSGDIWQRDLVPRDMTADESMRPLLHVSGPDRCRDRRRKEEDEHSCCECDSEQDDTEYVLSQMQKSRESLAQRSQKKQNDLGQSLEKKQRKEPEPSK